MSLIFWIVAIAVGVALGIVLGDWLRQGMPVLFAVYYTILGLVLVAYLAFLSVAFTRGWIAYAFQWVQRWITAI